jgi:hypothetical protein
VQSSFEEAEGSFQTQIKDLKEEVQRERVGELCMIRRLVGAHESTHAGDAARPGEATPQRASVDV